MSAIGADATPLRELVRTFSSALLGYSGGVDSSVLAVVLRQELGRDRMLAAIGRSASYPAAQWAAALTIARRFDVPVVEIDTHVTADLRVRHHGDRARIEVEADWIGWLEQRRDAVATRLLGLGFAAVEVDPRGYRRGSLILERRGRP